jgi:hypothetical protein
MHEIDTNERQHARATTRAVLRRPAGRGDAFVTPAVHCVTARAAAPDRAAENRTP